MAGIPVHSEDTGGNRGRTARITVGQRMTSQLAGGERKTLLDCGAPSAVTARPLGKPGLAGAKP